jgi:predicted transcriptional regulator
VIEAGVTKCDEIADNMKLPKYAVSRLAKKAIDAGWLTKTKRGEYVLKEAKK